MLAIPGTSGSGGNATPGGSNTQVQFNNNGAFGASANLTFDNTSNTLSTTSVNATTVYANNIGALAVYPALQGSYSPTNLVAFNPTPTKSFNLASLQLNATGNTFVYTGQDTAVFQITASMIGNTSSLYYIADSDSVQYAFAQTVTGATLNYGTMSATIPLTNGQSFDVVVGGSTTANVNIFSTMMISRIR